MTLRLRAELTPGRLRKLWYAPVLALSMGLMLVRLLIMARLLSLPEFAVYSAGLLVSSSFCMLACMGLQSLLQRDLPMMIVRQRERAGGVLLMQCTLVAAACAAVGAAVVVTGGVSLAGLSPTLLMVALIHGLSQQLFLIATIDSRSRNQPLRFARQNLERALAVLAAGVAVSALGGAASMVLATESVISLALAAWLLRQQFHAIPLRFVTAMRLAWRRLPTTRWRSALALLAVASLGFLVINADRWLAAQWLPGSAFAQYAFAWMLLMVAQSVQVVINASLYPMLARRYATDGGLRTFGMSARASLGLLAGGALAALPFWTLLDLGIARWFPAYAEARSLLPVFLVIAVLRVSNFWSSYLVVVGREGRLLILNLMSAGAAAATWWLLAPPSAGELRADQIALLALLLSASGYAVVALAAWHHAQTSREEPA
jgi:O-antigen/teichoic acid export membrane protein